MSNGPFADDLRLPRAQQTFWFYFSTSSYTTKGYGDVVLPQMWRIIAGRG
jgi:ion channel